MFAFVIYMLCIADAGPEEEDLDEAEDGVEFIDEDQEEKEQKESDEEADPSTKPKTD